MTTNTDPRITKAIIRVRQILDTHVLDQPDHSPLQESALIEILIRVDGILKAAIKAGKRVTFDDDIKQFRNVEDVTDAIHECRNAATHVFVNAQFANSRGQPKEGRSEPNSNHLWIDRNVSFGKGTLHDQPPITLRSDYDDDIAIFYGAHRLYLKRHIIRAFEKARENLGL